MRDQNARLSIFLDMFFLIILLGLFYNIGLNYYPLFTPDEGRYCEAAREMVVTHDYITPRVNGIAFLDKPILYYWLQAISIHLFGLSEWSLRFFPMLFGIMFSLATYLFGRMLFDRQTALLSAAILATSPLVFAMAHYANLDLEVATLITISLYAGMIALTRTPIHSPLLYIAVIAAALSVLTKGLIGVFFPGCILGLLFLYLKRWQAITLTQCVIAISLFFLIVLPWFIAVQIKNPQFFHYFFVTQHITRFLSHAEFNNKTPIWFYLPVIFIGFFPWSLFLYHAIKHTFQEVVRNTTHHRVHALFLLLFMFIVVIFFSLPQSKIISYILPVFPPLALMTGWYITSHWARLMAYKKCVYAFLILLGSMIITLTLLPFIAPTFNKHSTKAIAETLKPLLKLDSPVVTYYDYFYDLPLYLERNVMVVANWQDPGIMQRDNWRRELALGMRHQNVSSILINDNAFWQGWHTDKRWYAVMSISDLELFQRKTHKLYLIKKSHEIVLVTNQPH